MKIKKRILRFMLSMFAALQICFFISPPGTVSAREPAGRKTQIIMNTENADDIPKEFKEPINKTKKLIVYLVISFGVIVAIVGGVLFLITLTGHQTDMKMLGIIGFGVGILIALLPVFVNWVIPGADLL